MWNNRTNPERLSWQDAHLLVYLNRMEEAKSAYKELLERAYDKLPVLADSDREIFKEKLKVRESEFDRFFY